MRTRLALVLFAFGIVVACSSTDAKPKTLCSPNKPSYCRCQDREQGEKTCAADGNSYGPCIPCETFDNPEIPYDPSGPGEFPGDDDDFDGGFEFPDDAGQQPRCGDGFVQVGEDCDDKNANDDDGCNKACKLQGGTAQATTSCPGLNVDVWGGSHKPTLASATTGGGNHTTKTECIASGSTTTRGSATNDRAFRVTAHKSGTMKVVVTDTNYDAYLYVADACTDDVTQKACVNAKAGPADETLSFAVVDGKTGSAGTFKVSFSIE